MSHWENDARNILSNSWMNFNFQNVEMPGPSYDYIENH